MAYESQLKSDRAECTGAWRPRSKTCSPESAEENAALIAEHLEAAGELHAAYGWHMRAAAWATNRDIAAARLSWERARRIADAAARRRPRPVLDAHRAPHHAVRHRLASPVPATAGRRFAELRELCSAAGDKVSLAIGMTGLAIELMASGRAREASRLASEQMALLESIGDPTLTVGCRCPGDRQLVRHR